MAIVLQPANLTVEERTSKVTRSAPVGADYFVTLERERVYRDADQNIVYKKALPNIVVTVADLMAHPATADYLSACNAAAAPADLIAAEVAWYDALAASLG